jgi:hypothetical protein
MRTTSELRVALGGTSLSGGSSHSIAGRTIRGPQLQLIAEDHPMNRICTIALFGTVLTLLPKSAFAQRPTTTEAHPLLQQEKARLDAWSQKLDQWKLSRKIESDAIDAAKNRNEVWAAKEASELKCWADKIIEYAKVTRQWRDKNGRVHAEHPYRDWAIKEYEKLKARQSTLIAEADRRDKAISERIERYNADRVAYNNQVKEWNEANRVYKAHRDVQERRDAAASEGGRLSLSPDAKKKQ